MRNKSGDKIQKLPKSTPIKNGHYQLRQIEESLAMNKEVKIKPDQMKSIQTGQNKMEFIGNKVKSLVQSVNKENLKIPIKRNLKEKNPEQLKQKKLSKPFQVSRTKSNSFQSKRKVLKKTPTLRIKSQSSIQKKLKSKSKRIKPKSSFRSKSSQTDDSRRDQLKQSGQKNQLNQLAKSMGTATKQKLLTIKKRGKHTNPEEVKEAFNASIMNLILNDDVDDNIKILTEIQSYIDSVNGFASVPIILKVLVSYNDQLKLLYESKTDKMVKMKLANILSYSSTGCESNGDVLKYYLLGTHEVINLCGVDYVRTLTKELIDEMKNVNQKYDKNVLLKLVNDCANFFLKQNSEIEVCDLLIETENLDLLHQIIKNPEDVDKICNYIMVCSNYLPEPDDRNILYSAMSLYLNNQQLIKALFFAIKLHDSKMILKILLMSNNKLEQIQMAFILARHNIFVKNEQLSTEITESMSNKKLNYHFSLVAKHLDVLEPKAPKDIVNKATKFKNVRNKRLFNFDLSLLGASFMNCLMNGAFGNDKMLLSNNGLNWICRHKDIDRMSATASLGILCLWDVDTGFNKIDRYLYSKDEHIKAGALIASGIVSCSIHTEHNPAFALLKQYLKEKSLILRTGAILGLGMAYLGTNHNESLTEIMKSLNPNPLIKETDSLLGLSAMSIGLIGYSNCDETTIKTFVELINNQKMTLSNIVTRNIIHGIGLLVLNRKEELKKLLSLINQIKSEPVKEYAKLCFEICAHIGSSNILKIQDLIQICSPIIMKVEKPGPSDPKQPSLLQQTPSGAKTQVPASKKADEDIVTNEEYIQMLAIIGISLVGLTDNLNSELIFRTLGQFIKHGNYHIKGAALLAISILYLSEPRVNVTELLSKYSHSFQESVALISIFGLGLVSAGSNNNRIGKLLHGLIDYYHSKANYLFALKLAQGLLYLGKGLLTLSPQMEVGIIRNSSICSIFLIATNLVRPIELIKQFHYYLFIIAGTIRPKMLVTLDEELKLISIPIRIGQAVDVIGQAGNPRTISAFQTLTTPALLNKNDGAELATDQYRLLTNHLEGIVIVQKNHEAKQGLDRMYFK